MDRRLDEIFDDNAPPGIFFVEGLPSDEFDEESDLSDLDFEQAGSSNDENSDEDDDDDDDDDDDEYEDEYDEDDDYYATSDSWPDSFEMNHEIAESESDTPRTGVLDGDESEYDIHTDESFSGREEFMDFSEPEFSSASESGQKAETSEPEPVWTDRTCNATEMNLMIAFAEDFDPDWTLQYTYCRAYNKWDVKTVVELLESKSYTKLSESEFLSTSTRSKIRTLLELFSQIDERVKMSALQSLDLNSNQRESIALALINGVDCAIAKQVYRLCRNSILFNDCDPILRLPELFKALLSTYTLPAFYSEPSAQTSFDCALSYSQAFFLLTHEYIQRKSHEDVMKSLLSSCAKFLLPITWTVEQMIMRLQTLYIKDAEQTAKLVESMPEAWLATVGRNFGPFIQFELKPEVLNWFPGDVSRFDAKKSLLSNALDFEQQNQLLFASKGTLTTYPNTALNLARTSKNCSLIEASLTIHTFRNSNPGKHPYFTKETCTALNKLYRDFRMFHQVKFTLRTLLEPFHVHNNATHTLAFPAQSCEIVLKENSIKSKYFESDDLRQHLQPYWPHCPIYIAQNKLHVVQQVNRKLEYAAIPIPLKRELGHGKYIRLQAFCIDNKNSNQFYERSRYKYNSTGYFATSRGIFAYQENSRNKIRIISRLSHRAMSMSATNDGFMMITRHNAQWRQSLLYYRVTNNVELVWSFLLPDDVNYQRVVACPSDPTFCLLSTYQWDVHTARIGKELQVSVFRKESCVKYYLRGFTGCCDKYIVLYEEHEALVQPEHPYSAFTKADLDAANKTINRLVVYNRFHRKVAYESVSTATEPCAVDMQINETELVARYPDKVNVYSPDR